MTGDPFWLLPQGYNIYVQVQLRFIGVLARPVGRMRKVRAVAISAIQI